jgi:arabinan endo-1,5-alpha-L-arabinosidase
LINRLQLLLYTIALALLGPGLLAQSSGPPLRGYLATHDPSTIIQCKDRYYVFYTGQGILSKSSADRVFWAPGPSVFTNPPSWTSVPGFTGLFWAPDVLYFSGQYHLWYAVSTFGSQVSAIGLVTNPTLDPADPAYKWTDQGPVIASTNGSPYNTIDPSFCWDDSGNLWMAFGSYWNGIYLVQLNATTGLRLSATSPTYHLAYNSSIEASYLYKRNGYYYLFANWGSCCSGVNSTYNMRVGRATTITGPYLDQDGISMVDNGGSLFQEGTGKFTGPGHVGIFSTNGSDWLSYHYYDANAWDAGYDAYGAPNLAVVPLSWTSDGWPAFTNTWSALYKFQADARDENGQYYGLLQNGASVQSDPVYGRVLNLTGTNQYVWLPPGVAYAKTFAAVVKWRGGAPWQRIFDFGFDTSKTVMLTAASGDNVLRCDLNPGGNLQTVQWTRPLPTNVWTHVAVTFDGAQSILYVNGKPAATNVNMNLLPLDVAPQTNHLGRSKFTADPYFNGEFASFRAYSHTLSPSEIIAPVPEITQPSDGSAIQPGGVIRFAGSATDFMALPLSTNNLTWEIVYTSNSVSSLLMGPLQGVAGGTFIIPTNATAGYYSVVLIATDDSGRAATNVSTVYPSATVASDNWSSFYPFVSGAQDSSNMNNGVLQSGAAIRIDPARGDVLSLAGSGQYVSLPAETGSAQTILGWVKWSGGNAWQRVFDFGQDTSDFFFFTPADSSGHAQCAITANSSIYNNVIESPSAFPVNQWTRVAVVMDGREGILFLNGQAVAVNNSINLLPSDIAATHCYFGKSQFAADPTFAGALSDFHLNSQPLSLLQMATPQPILSIGQNQSGLILSWPQWANARALYTTTNLSNSSWTQVASAPQNSNDAFTLALPPTNILQFFRIQTQ